MLRLLIAFVALIAVGTVADATPLNSWKTSCSVDAGSLVKKGKTRTFKTSKNRCPGGTFKQRSEIKSKNISPNHKGKYLFTANVSMTNARNEKFDIFQMHDGRDGCAPPLKVTVLSNNSIELRADYKTGPGESCVRDVLRHKKSNVKFKRGGVKQKLSVVIEFLGQANFTVQVYLDGKLAASGNYVPPSGSGYKASRHFYFKHGVYSKNMFDYVMVSENMKVSRIRK
jgi:hypothetical protein